MARKKKGGGGDGGGADWMGTYGDMITLLLCFFVLLYSMSTISEENYKALVMSFNPDAALTMTITSGGDGPNADSDDGEGGPIEEMTAMAVTQEEIDEQLDLLFMALKDFADSQNAQNNQENNQGDISVTKGSGKVFVTFSNTVFFAGESYELLPGAYPILDNVGEMLSQSAFAIDEVRILGHTAQASMSRPNNVRNDRMLSAQRSAMVVSYVQQHTLLDAAKLVSEGLGQWKPVADNSTAEGRAQNRRVEMVISGRDLEMEDHEIMQYSTSD